MTTDEKRAPLTRTQLIWGGYAACEECGVDEGEVCRDENDNRAMTACAGRKLRVVPLAPREKMGRPRQTLCMRGHVLSPENVYLKADGERACRECTLIHAKTRRDKARAAKKQATT